MIISTLLGTKFSTCLSVLNFYGNASTFTKTGHKRVQLYSSKKDIPMKAGCNSTPQSSCMRNIRTLEPDFEYIGTQKYQVMAMIFGYYFYECTR